MPDRFTLTDGEAVEYKAFVRFFEHSSDDEPRGAVLYVVMTLTKPDSGWRFLIVEQEGEPDLWRSFQDAPASADGDRTYYGAIGTTEKEIDGIPRSIVVLDADGEHRVSVAPWD